MLWLKARIDRMQELIDERSSQSLTYAALEARLAIEHLCYERLQISHGYIAHEDLKRWQPGHIVTQIMKEVDPHVASSFTVSMATAPVQSDAGEWTREDYEQQEYVEIGHQIGFDAKKIGKLWQALGNFLHLRIPKSREDIVVDYVDVATLEPKLQEVLSELKRIAHSTLIGTVVGETISLECECGASNPRAKAPLTNGQVISCFNPKCIEKWQVQMEGEEIYFKQVSIKINCHSCSEAINVALSALQDPKPYRAVQFSCRNCGAENYLRWKLMHEKLVRPDK